MASPQEHKATDRLDAPIGYAYAGTSSGRNRRPMSRVVVCDLLRVVDVLVVLLSSYVAFLVYNFAVLRQGLGDWNETFVQPTILALLISIVAFSASGLYQQDRLTSWSSQAVRLSAAWTATVCLLLVAAFLAKTTHFSRGWVLVWWGATLLSSGTIHLSVVHFLRKSGRLVRRVAVYGSGPEAERVVRALRARPDGGEAHGIFDDRTMARAPQYVGGLPVVGTSTDLLEAARTGLVDQIIVALPLTQQKRIADIVERFRELPVDIGVSLNLLEPALRARGTFQIGSVTSIQVARRALSDWAEIWKAIEDKCLTLLIIMGIAPLMILIAIAIRLDSRGPILFRQERFGFNNQRIVVYKFRTMHHNQRDKSGAIQTKKDDPRVTRLGRVLRRTNLDELPQFINVLQGRLSIVGPRPHALTMKAADQLYHEAVDNYAVRHRVKPGITGWAQIHGLRGETDTMEKARKRVEYDLFYIDNWSVTLDLRIILLTLVRSFRDPNAY